MRTTIKSQKARDRQNLTLGGDVMRLTPSLFLLPHVFHLIRERDQVVPDDYRHYRMDKILK